MKTSKTILSALAIVAALAFCAPGAKATYAPRTGITTNFTPVNISITVTTNGVEKSPSTDTYTRATGKAKIDNSTLLKIFAHWAGVSSWPAGTKLVIGWDEPWNGNVLVVDKNGTNVLYNTYSTNSNYFYLDFYDDSDYVGASSYKEVDKDPGSYADDESFYGYFELYDDDVYLPYTYIYGYGNTTISYTQNWDANHKYTTWTQSTELKNGEYNYYEMYYLDEEYVTVSGSVTSSGSGKGENYWYGY